MGKASHRGHRGHGGGNGGLDGWGSSVDTGAAGRENKRNGEKHRTEVTEGDGGLDGGGSFRKRPSLPCEKKADTLFYRRFTDRISMGTNPNPPLRDLCAMLSC
jgi:hypothetical protein